MANRNKNYSEIMAKNFEDLEYSQTYLTELVNSQELDIAEALRVTIEAMGLKTFSEKSKLSVQGVSDFVSKRLEWSTDKMLRIIYSVFKLEVKLTIIAPKKDVA